MLVGCTLMFAQYGIAFGDSLTPSPAEILKVYNYMRGGQHGEILYDSRLTSSIENSNPVDHVTQIELGNEVNVWMNFILPANYVDENYTVTIQRGPIPEFVNKPVLRRENNAGSLYHRVVRKFKPRRPGKYKVIIYRRDIIIQEFEFDVIRG